VTLTKVKIDKEKNPINPNYAMLLLTVVTYEATLGYICRMPISC
jgi:hypothetical protein